MNLAQTLEIFGGGPGSGCQGPNCGRPAGEHHLEPEEQVVKTGLGKKEVRDGVLVYYPTFADTAKVGQGTVAIIAGRNAMTSHDSTAGTKYVYKGQSYRAKNLDEAVDWAVGLHIREQTRREQRGQRPQGMVWGNEEDGMNQQMVEKIYSRGLSVDELQDGIRKQLNPSSGLDKGSPEVAQGPSASTPFAYIEKVYPEEKEVIYRLRDKTFKRKYKIGKDGTVSLTGEPKEVKQAYVEASAVYTTPAERAMRIQAQTVVSEAGRKELKQLNLLAHALLEEVLATIDDRTDTPNDLGMGPKSPAANLRFIGKNGKSKYLKELLPMYKAACKAGWECKACSASGEIQAKAPAGWESTVKKMKKHKDIDNPWALSAWMKEQGYSPGGSKK